MLKLKFLVSIMAMSFIVGCGDGSSSTVVDDGINTVDNSVLADGSTSLGYYGEAVMFGNHTVVREWILTVPSQPNDPIYVILSTGSEGYKIEGLSIDSLDFGVSKDGRSVLIDEGTPALIEMGLFSATSKDCYSGYIKNVSTSETLNIGICVQVI